MLLRRILVPTDFSERSERALAYAAGLAQRDGAAIDLVHVIPPPGILQLAFDAYLDRPLPSVDEAVRRELQARLEHACSRVSHADSPLSCFLEVGEPAATIVRVAVERRADLIVIGTRARTGLTEAVLGSVAHQVITCAPCPVVTLRGDEVLPRVVIGAAPEPSP